MPSTEEYWEIDGVVLNEYAWNIQTIGGNRFSPPPVRGENLLIPLNPGRRWQEKFPDEKVITLGMWVQGCNPDGSIPEDRTAHQKFMENWNMLSKLFYRPWRQYTITRRWWHNGEIKEATALASFAGGLEPEMHGGGHAAFTVDLSLPDPYFYGPEEEWQMDAGVPGGFTQALTHDGDDILRKLTVRMFGPLENPKLVSTGPSPNVYVKYAGVIPADRWVILDTLNFTALYTGGGPNPVNVLGNVKWGGTRHWMLLLPGLNALRFEDDTQQGGYCVVKWQPNYF